MGGDPAALRAARTLPVSAKTGGPQHSRAGRQKTPEVSPDGLPVAVLGKHPFAGRYAGTGDMPISKAMEEYRFPYGANAAAAVCDCSPPPADRNPNDSPSWYAARRPSRHAHRTQKYDLEDAPTPFEVGRPALEGILKLLEKEFDRLSQLALFWWREVVDAGFHKQRSVDHCVHSRDKPRIYRLTRLPA